MISPKPAVFSNQTDRETDAANLLESIMRSDLLPPGELLRNLTLFLRQKDLAHILFMAEIYRRVADVPGYVGEFGVMWGRNLALLLALRECLEPYNHTRRVIGFDTFAGFMGTTDKDRTATTRDRGLHKQGAYSVSPRYEATLAELLSAHQNTAHLAHVKKFELVKGDVEETFARWLEVNPQAIFALCYLDLDLHSPTKSVLKLLKDRLVRGSILVFDEVLNPDYPGETQALQEVFGLPNLRLQRTPLSGWKTYCVLD